MRANWVKISFFLRCAHLSDELHDEVHHQLGVLVEHALPQLVHHALAEVEDVVHQDLVAAAAAQGEGRILACDKGFRSQLVVVFWGQRGGILVPKDSPAGGVVREARRFAC